MAWNDYVIKTTIFAVYIAADPLDIYRDINCLHADTYYVAGTAKTVFVYYTPVAWCPIGTGLDGRFLHRIFSGISDYVSQLRLYGVVGVGGGYIVIDGLAFSDFLTTETLAFVIPMAIVYGIWRRKGTLKNFKEEVLYLLRAGCCWGMAYIGSYLIKWTLASVFYGEERFSVALSQLAGRQGNSVTNYAIDSLSGNGIPVEALQNAGGDVLPQFLSAVVINIRLLLGLSGKISLEKLALLLLVIGLLVAAVIYLFRKPGRVEVLSGILFLLGTIPMLRMMVLNNHSTEHCFFVYRSLYGTIICFSAGIIHLFDWEFLRRRRKKWG